MHVPLVMTVIGRDRPGLAEVIGRRAAGHSGNWLESRMCRLGGEFARLRAGLEPIAADLQIQTTLAAPANPVK